MSLTLTDQDRTTLRTAAYGAVSPHKVATEGSIALATATGPIGHVLAAKTKTSAARTHQGRPSPTLADMIRKITAALDAA
ncbi:hypothetical protein [Nonomuraea jabiensis]|uniref:hypothetical protein n=1 Tax=Nonomuraea jabiensis TaxID=882448 RepID=UPI003D75F608